MGMMRTAQMCVVTSALVLSGCTSSGGLSSQDVGGILGAIAGGVVGAQFGSGSGKTAATVFGALLGGYAGRAIASRLTQKDYAYRDKAAYDAVNSGQSQTWRNAESGNSGKVTPTQSYQRGSQKCTRFNETVQAGGESAQGQATACQQPDGSWQIYSS